MDGPVKPGHDDISQFLSRVLAYLAHMARCPGILGNSTPYSIHRDGGGSVELVMTCRG
jgi:hypothetical protein